MRAAIAWACALLAVAMASPAAQAQSDFPSRPITILVPFPPGGSSDVMTRAVAQKVADNLKANIVIDNRGGGGGVPAALATKQAAPDGYTLFLANNGLFAIMPAMTEVRFDPVKDFAPITPIVSFPSVLMVPAAMPASTVNELVAHAKTKSGGLNFASQGVGSGGHVLGEMLRLKTGAPMVHVPYRGAAPAVVDIAAGNIDMLFGSYVSVAGQVQAGRVRLLGWTASKRSAAIPDVPTMEEAGYPGTELEIWHGLVAPAGTPAPIMRKLNEEFVKALRSPDVVKMMGQQAADPLPASPEDFAKLIAGDIERLGKVVRDAGIKMQ